MRVGIFGGLSNVGYNIGKILQKRGIDVELIHNPHISFAFSQPFWDDSPTVVDAEHLVADQASWSRKVEEIGWKRPDWVRNVSMRSREIALRHPRLAFGALRRCGLSLAAARFALGGLHLAGPLSEFDFLILLGIGPIYGSLAGVPYVAIPLGSDIMWLPYQSGVLSRLQRQGYARSRRVLTSDWRFVKSLVWMGMSNWTYFPLPIDVEAWSESAGVGSLWPASVEGKFVFFMPSGHDFRKVGTDRVLRAFLRLSRNRDDIVLVTSNWGIDSVRVREMVRPEDDVVLLPYVVSRPIMRSFYHASDVVIAEFVCGSYGLTVLEAMACGKPVISNVKSQEYQPYLHRLPPVLQAETEDEIFRQMKWAVENPDAVSRIGKESREWVASEHSSESVQTVMEFAEA